MIFCENVNSLYDCELIVLNIFKRKFCCVTIGNYIFFIFCWYFKSIYFKNIYYYRWSILSALFCPVILFYAILCYASCNVIYSWWYFLCLSISRTDFYVFILFFFRNIWSPIVDICTTPFLHPLVGVSVMSCGYFTPNSPLF